MSDSSTSILPQVNENAIGVVSDNLRDERTLGIAAVIGVNADEGCCGVIPAAPLKHIPGAQGTESPGLSGGRKSKRSKVQKLARRAAYLRGPGSYVHIGQYYNSREPESLKAKLKGCQYVWLRERKGDAIRWRGRGCGERDICPVCGSYLQWVLANEASESMLLAQTGLEVGGLELQSYGLKLVLTIPKTESARIDGLLWTDTKVWTEAVGGLFKLSYAFVERWYGAGCGGVVGMHYTGESAPSEPHYHSNVYVFPARRVGGRWVPLGRWIDDVELGKMRAVWTGMVNKAFGLELKEANLEAGYLGKVGMFKGWLQYLYKHSLADLWRGWQGVQDGLVKYRIGKGGKEQMLTGEDLTKICERLPARYEKDEYGLSAPVSMGRIPQHFKRIRWFGIFSDGQRSKTMASLGLEPVEVAADDDGEGKSWVQEGEPATFVRYTPAGVVLRTAEGVNFLVPDKLTDYRPSGVSIGKRKRWREPGGR